MPHFGLMDAEALGPEQAALRRARLHLRGGRRRLRQGRISAGVAALYDALTSALAWYCASAERRSRLQVAGGLIATDKALYSALVRAAVLDGALDFDRLDRVLDQALEGEISATAAAGILEGVESVLTQLGVLPFDEAGLPPEDPGTI